MKKIKSDKRLNNREKGAYGEKVALEYLKNQKYKILDKNWHYSKFCELDIIAKEKDTIVFVEVKYRTTKNFGVPFEAINNSKLSNLRMAIMAYIQQTKEKFKNYRLDVIGIVGELSPEISHLKNIEL